MLLPTLTRTILTRRLPRSAPSIGSLRHLNLHEYQSAQIMKSCGVNVPLGIPAHTVEEAVAAAKDIGDEKVVIKSQILAGGRGLGVFTSGLEGGVHIIDSKGESHAWLF
jgi:succinyl-CoA synthetase beta subunit